MISVVTSILVDFVEVFVLLLLSIAKRKVNSKSEAPVCCSMTVIIPITYIDMFVVGIGR